MRDIQELNLVKNNKYAMKHESRIVIDDHIIGDNIFVFCFQS